MSHRIKNRAMKVCILTERMRLGFGVDLVVDEQARRLLRLGYEVVVVVIHGDLIQPRREYKLVIISRIMAVGDIGSEVQMRRILSRCKVDADLWILHTPPFYDWAKYLEGPVILVEHGAPPGHFFPPHVARQVDSTVERRLTEIYSLLRPCDAIVSISNSIHAWLPKTVQPFSSVIHHGCDHYAQVSSDEAFTLRNRLGIGSDECMILWVGRMQLANDEQPYKGFQELLALIPLVRRQVENVRFVLVGRVSDKDKYKIEDYGVTVLANQSSEELARAYAAADVFINLARWEGFNLALLEAQSQGTPVVAYDLGPHPEVVRHNETGLLVKTPRDFFESVVKISTDRPLREKLAARARTFARDFTWDKSVAELVKVITACTSSDLPRNDVAALRRGAAFAKPPDVQPPAHVRDILKLDDRDFLTMACMTLLTQTPDLTDKASWLRQLRRGVSKRTVLLQIADFANARGIGRNVPGLRATLLIARAIQPFRRIVARREPVHWSGVATTSKEFTAAKAPKSVAELLALYDEEFVRSAYLTVLGRPADAGGLAAYLEHVRSGADRAELLVALATSSEGQQLDPRRIRGLVEIVEASQRRRASFHARLISGAHRLRAASLPINRVLGRRRKILAEREDMRRQIGPVDSQQSVLAAEFRKFRTTLESVADDIRSFENVAERLGALEVKIGARRADVQVLQESLFAAPSSVGRSSGTPVTTPLTTFRLGPSHVALIAPGALLDPGALPRLAQAARVSNSDILFGNEFERLDKPPFQRLRIHGPFSHDAFLRSPDLGGVIAVHKSLIAQTQWSQTVALTGQVALQLVALAHTVTHVPATLSERKRSDITASRPTIADMRTYLDRIGRRALIAEDGAAGFDVRFPNISEWKAAIIVMQGDDDGEQSLVNIRANTAPHRYHLVQVRPSESSDVDNELSPALSQHPTVLTFHRDMPYGEKINEAVRRAPAECNLVVVMDGGVSPTASDWLERLAESALLCGVGAVAPMTLYPSGQIRHAGMAVGFGRPCAYVSRFVCSDDIDGGGQDVELDRLNGMREVSIVSHHCMVFRRSVFHEQGRFEKALGQEATDIEFCCRLHCAGLSVVVDGRIVMIQPDPAPRWARSVPSEDLLALWIKHSHFLAGPDRFWNPSQAVASSGAHDITGIRTVRLPPLEDR
jgi:glycosyltransferase involved in cell wall biosynthesis/GT2 family glycosyltransferase